MTDPLSQPTPQRTYDLMRSPRALLWARLEAAHARLAMETPTATLTLEVLQAEVERLEAVNGLPDQL
jgi:hypothetical protein